MTTLHQEIVVPKPEHEAQEVDGSSQESSSETTKELFRRDSPKEETPLEPIKTPEKEKSPPPVETPKRPTTSPASPTSKSSYSNRPIIIKTPQMKNESATKKRSSSGIPLRMKSGPNAVTKPANKTGGSYRLPSVQPMGPVINKNTLEVQFMNNKKRLLQLHSELVDRQRPLLDMHKSLLRTKKQLEDLGKKVVLEDLKIISLKTDDARTQMDGAGENPAAETAMNLKSSIENALDACVKVCKKCLVKRDKVVKMLESASKSAIEPSEIEAEVEELKKERDDLERSVESTIKENEKKIEEVINNWQKAVKLGNANDQMTNKITELEETVKQQQKAIQEAEDNLHSLTRKFEDKKASYEKSINEVQEKNAKLEDDLKKEKKNANENLMKSRNMRSKVTDLEARTKEAEEKSNDVSNKLKQLQEQMRRKEVQWMKEKDEFKKNEALLQQKFSEKQSQFDTRLKDFEMLQKNAEQQQQNFCRNFETQLEIKDQEFSLMEKEKEALAEKTKILEEQVEEMRKQLEKKEKEIDELNVKVETVPAIEYKQSESHWLELMESKQKIAEVQNTIHQQNEQIDKMQGSLKAHAKLAAALKLEKDNAIKYSNKLRDVLQEARDELEFKNKTIYKIHEKLVLKDRAYDKLKQQIKEFESYQEHFGEKSSRNRCQICMSSLSAEKTDMSCAETEVGKCSTSFPQYVSESLIGMSVKKVDHLRARLDNLKKMKLPRNSGGKKHLNVNYSFTASDNKPINSHLRKQIELRGKLYQILQKHADQSCEDFINLLKLTVSNAGKDPNTNELKPSNIKQLDELIHNSPRKYPSNVKVSDSFSEISQIIGTVPIDEIYEKLNDNGNSDTDDMIY